jgi:hypothetical protein
MSETRQVGLYHTDEFGADEIEPWERHRLRRLALDGKRAARTAQASPGTPPSLANCEKVSERPAVPDFSDPRLSGGTRALKHILHYYDGVEQAARLAERIAGTTLAEHLVSASPQRARKALALAEAGEVAHAGRMVMCRKKSVQLECPDEFGAGGCGSTDNYVPINCDSRLCPDCMKRKMGHKVGQYEPVVERWDHPTELRLSLDRRVDPDDVERAVNELRGAHSDLRRRVVPPSGDGWDWDDWKRKLRMFYAHDLARRWQKRYVEQDRGIPFDEVVRSGFYGIDIKQGQDRTLNVHMHLLADVPWLPQAALSALWDELTDAPNVFIRRVNGTEEGALMEAVGYAAKAPEYESLDDQVTYLQTLKGSKLIQPFGDLHGNTPPNPAGLLCADCGRTPRWWNFFGIVKGEYNTVEVVAGKGDRPPP